ncbi:hypothetical protein Tco_0044422 [Tanacetum coccineum]
MANLKFADTHNMVAFLSKPTESDGLEQIFWSTVKAKTINGEVQLHALVDSKKIIIESTVRRDLQLEDAKGVDCLPNSTIFEQLTLMGYEKISQKLTFYKPFFSPQWKFLIHILYMSMFKDTAMEDEAVHKELGDSLVEGDTYAFSLEHSRTSGGGPRVLYLEKTKTTQANEIASLKRRVKKLEKKNRSRTHKLKRLYKVGLTAKVESSRDEESLGEDASKQGRINAINADDDIILVNLQQKFLHNNHRNKGKGIMIEEHVKPMKKKEYNRLDKKLL